MFTQWYYDVTDNAPTNHTFESVSLTLSFGTFFSYLVVFTGYFGLTGAENNSRIVFIADTNILTKKLEEGLNSMGSVPHRSEFYII